jgi:hypothetical protein
MHAVRPIAAGILAALVLAVAGCGAAANDSTKDFKGESRDVAQTVEDFQDAAQSSDEEKICNDLLAGALVRTIEGAREGRAAEKGSCPDRLKDSLRDADTFEIDVKKVTVSGTTATAVVRSKGGEEDRDDTLKLVKEGTPSEWRISALG